jgi:hypothetical protein
VSERENVGAQLEPSALEERMAHRVGCRFNRHAAGPSQRPDIRTIDNDRPSERFRHAFRKPLVLVGRRSELVVEMREPHRVECAGIAQRADEVRERHRVATARQRNDDTSICISEMMTGDRALNAIEESHMRTGQASPVG